MGNDNKQQDQQANDLNAESNAGRDQDHGNMNNGTLGGSMGTIGVSEEEKQNENQNLAATDGGKS